MYPLHKIVKGGNDTMEEELTNKLEKRHKKDPVFSKMLMRVRDAWATYNRNRYGKHGKNRPILVCPNCNGLVLWEKLNDAQGYFCKECCGFISPLIDGSLEHEESMRKNFKEENKN